MNTLTWNDTLALNHTQMDQTHREFVDLLGAVQNALPELVPDVILERFRELVLHTDAHFSQEERWMQDVGFDADNCHSRQHAMVLRVMRDVERVARDESNFEPLQRIVGELVEWFPQHAQMMDSALAEQMAERGYDPITRQSTKPVAQAELITGCGSGSCS